MRLAVVALVGACGRINFDPTGDAGADATFRCAAKDVDVGSFHTCVVDSVGAVWCWGNNIFNQSVPGGARYVTVPARVELPTTAAQVAVGGDHSCARLDDGTVWCWGQNTFGQLGNASTGTVNVPVAAALGGERAIDLDAGTEHTCIRRESDAAVMCWGNNALLQTGDAGATTTTPTVVAGTAGAKQLDLGHRTSCIVDASDRAACWGFNRFAQLGITGANSATPLVVGGLGAVARVAAGGPFTCAIETTGNLRCWGRNDAWQLGAAGASPQPTPQSPIINDALDAHPEGFSGIAVRRDGSLVGWGGGGSVYPIDEVANVTQLSGEFFHECAVAGGGLTCMGWNLDGELGRGTRSTSEFPIPIEIPGTADHVAAGGEHGCASVAGAVWCWGTVKCDVADCVTPTIFATGLASIEGLSSQYFHTCAWGGGAASCWGNNAFGELGTGVISGEQAPQNVTVATGVTQMSTGFFHTCALVATGVVCWGNNGNGQLGDGSLTSSTAAVGVLNLPAPITKIASGGGTNCAIANAGVWCWGSNLFGQIGDGTMTDRPLAQNIAVPGTPMDVGTSDHTCALTTAGEVYCWGNNVAGQLGVGDTMPRTMPALVMLPAAANQLVVGTNGTCVVLVDGRVACWGAGERGENGNGIAMDVLSPTIAPDLFGATAIARGLRGGCAIVGGKPRCFGWPNMLARTDPLYRGGPMAPLLNCP